MTEQKREEWLTAELLRDFVVRGYHAPYVRVTRKSDFRRGTLKFRHSDNPRVYYGWLAD